MKIKLTFLFCLSCFINSATAQCHLPMDISLDSTANLLWEWYLEKGDTLSKKSYRQVFDRLKKNASHPRYDSLFRVARQYLVDKLGDDIYCKRVDMDLWYATKFYRMQCEFEFRFFIADIGQPKKVHFKKYRFYFQWDETTGEMKQAHFPEILDCSNDPALCQFKVLNEDDAFHVADDAGLIGNERVFSRTASNSGWVWEIEKRLNDDCLAEKILVNMYTGEASLSEKYSWWGCAPLMKKVGNSPIVIEGTVLERGGGYKAKQGIWSSRLVEVNRIFKGEVPTGVVEVIAVGGSLGGIETSISHGQFSLPPKGSTAIFYLRSPWDEGGPDDGRKIDSLSSYPVFYAHYYDPLELYPSLGDKRSFHLDVEHNTYQPLEKATGQKRRNIRLPAVPDSAFVFWAIHHLREYPVREIGLEYQLFKKYGDDDPDTLRLQLGIRSPASHSYLTKSKIVLRYSPAALGDSIVAKGRLTFVPRFQKPHYDSHTFGKLLPPDSYRFELKDLSDSTFQIEISRPSGEGEYFLVTPFSYSKVLPSLPVAVLEIPVEDKEAIQGFDFVESEMQNTHFHYDFEKGEEVPYFFVWPNDMPDFPPERYRRR